MHQCRHHLLSGVPPRSREAAGLPRVARLTSFHKNLPHDTTNDFIMGGVAQTLDDESIQAIAAWLSSLAPAPGSSGAEIK
jgi:cytochrome c553